MRRVLLIPNEFTYSAAAGQRELSAAPKPSATVRHTRGFDCMRLANDLAAGDSSSFLLRNLANKSFSSVCESVCVCVCVCGGERHLCRQLASWTTCVQTRWGRLAARSPWAGDVMMMHKKLRSCQEAIFWWQSHRLAALPRTSQGPGACSPGHHVKNSLHSPKALDLLMQTEEWLTDSRGFRVPCGDC